jgi:phosphate:Na+ symporter
MARGVQEMMDWLRVSIESRHGDKALEKKLFHREKMFDLVQKEIVEFIGKMMTGTLSHDVTKEVHKQLRMADEFESISDYITDILKLRLRMRNDGLEFHEKGIEEMLQLHDLVAEYTQMLCDAVESRDGGILPRALSEGDTITHRVKHYRNSHLARLERKETAPLASLVFMDMLSAYRRIKDHGLNIAEVLAGEK